jgi:toxin HigB-1
MPCIQSCNREKPSHNRGARPACFSIHNPNFHCLNCSGCGKKLDGCYPLGYNPLVIDSFAHKGLERFCRTGNVSGIQAIHATKLRLVLSLLEAAQTVEGMKLPALKLHRLKGTRNDTWAVSVQANWRITFRFVKGNAHAVNYEDYH